MKFVSWNVNGLRACITKGFLDRFNELNADFFCLQETKLSEGQLKMDMPGYEQYWCYAEKKGYSGTAIFTKHTPQSVRYGIGMPELDNEGRVITLEYPEFYLVTCYTPNAQRGLARIGHRMKWDEAFRTFLRELDKCKPVILCGDLNVAHKEIDLKNPSSNRGNAGFSDEERSSFQNTLDLGFTDTFRHLYPDAAGRYSWWSYMFKARENNAGWRIDYFLTSQRLNDAIRGADILSDIMGSDHCPVTLDMNITCNGGIWSPEPTGKAAVIEPAEKPKKEPKASANKAKALSAFLMIFLLMLGGGASLWFTLNSMMEDGPAVSEAAPSFEIEIFDAPPESILHFARELSASDAGFDTALGISSEKGFITIPFSEVQEPQTAVDTILNSNVWFQIKLTSDAADCPQNLQPYFKCTTYWMSMDALENQSDFESVAALKYYTGSEIQTPGGWYVFGKLRDRSTFQVALAADEASAVFDTEIILTPLIETVILDAPETGYLATQIINNEAINDAWFNYLITSSNSTGEGSYLALCQKFPQLTELEKREDAIDALMNAECQTDNASTLAHWLLGQSVYRDRMTAVQESAYLTLHYPSWPHGPSVFDINTADWTTDELVQWLMAEEEFIYIMTGCRSTESARIAIELMCETWSPLRELLSRDDAITAVMNCTPPAGSLAAVYLLSTNELRCRMDPREEYLFLTNQYASYPYQIFRTPNENADVDSMTTAQLVAEYFSTTDVLNVLFKQCNSTEAMYLICQYYRQYDPYLDAMLSREDLTEVLEPLSNFHRGEIVYGGTDNVYDYLIEVRAYMDNLERNLDQYPVDK